MNIYIVFGVLAAIMLIVFKKSGNFFKSLLTSVIGGIGALCAVGAVSYFIPLTLGINLTTLGFSALLSVPGVILMLILKTFVM